MKKSLLVFFILIISILNIFAAGTATQVQSKIPLVILPAKSTTYWWNDDVVGVLMGLIEEKAIEAKRFNVLSRGNIDSVLQEKKLALAGIIENDALAVSKIAGGKYAVLLTLNLLETNWNAKINAYQTLMNVTIKAYDLESTELLATKKVDSTGTDTKVANNSLQNAINSLTDSIFITLREFFPETGVVQDLQGGYARIGGIDPSIVGLGYIFEVDNEIGSGYLVVTKTGKEYVTAKVKYGPIQIGNSVKEIPVLNYWGGAGLSFAMTSAKDTSLSKYFSGPAFSISGMSDLAIAPVQGIVDIGLILSDFSFHYTPFYATVAAAMKVFEMERISVLPYAGLSLIGYYSSYFNDSAYIIGVGAGARVNYEFSPRLAVSGYAGLNMYLNDAVNSSITIGVQGMFR